jgi:hypothetical protein
MDALTNVSSAYLVIGYQIYIVQYATAYKLEHYLKFVRITRRQMVFAALAYSTIQPHDEVAIPEHFIESRAAKASAYVSSNLIRGYKNSKGDSA